MRHVLFCLLLGFPLSAVWSPLQAHTIQGWSFWEQPDGTTFWGYVSGDEISVTYETADGYKFIPNSDDGYCYYAVVGESGEFRLSTARVGVDDPKAVSIVPGLERSAVRQAEINAERVRRGYSGSLPDRTSSGRPAAGKALLGAPATAPCTADDPCNLYVVLVTFVDETSGGSVFADYDMPYGYSGNDFRRLFYGDYEGVLPFTGTQTLTGGEQVDVFGSLRAYFHEVHGEDILRVQILNAEDENGLRWLPLPNTKHHYAGQSAFDFFEAAEDATIAPANQYDPATGAGFLHPIPTDFPTAASSLNTVLQNKVVYLYSGAVFTPGAQQASATPGVIQNSGIHPQANRITLSNPTTAGPNGDVGYQYVVGERQGFGWTDDAVDCFTGIGLHVHEIGHQFGFIHPDGLWHGNNPHTGLTADFDNANLLQWGAMQSGAHGPPLASGGYTIPYRSCPNPYNPIYRLDLGWNTVQDITTTAFNQRIEPGPAHIYRIPATATANGQMYILEHRSLGADASRGFGKYVSWHLLPTAPGLLLWRREPLNPASPPLLIFEPPPTLIPADQRSISDARPDGGANPSTEEWEDIPTDPFPGPDNVLHATDATGHLRHATRDEPGGGISASPDPGDSHIAIRNITNNTDHSVVDIYINYWAGPITAPTTWSGTVYVGGDVTIASGVTLTVDSGAEVRFLVNTDDTESGDDMDRSELIVEGVLVASDVTFRSANDEPSQNEWYGIHVESGGNATLTNVTIRDGMHCVSADDDNDLVLNNLSLANCGTPPTISGDQEPEFPERSEEVVETYMADDAEEDSVTWSLAEDPSDAFTINNNGELRFQDVPDFEALNAYDVTVRAEDSQQAVSDYPVTVEVINIEEAGTVTVSSPSDPPRVGEELTAQLEEDPDGVITGTERWTWQRQAPGTTGWPNITDATDAEYTPDTDDIGYLLQATVSYDDGQGTGKSAVSEPTAAVVGAPAAPEVKATAADARVVLTWQAAPANGLPVQYYETQYSADGGSNWSGFTEVDRKDTARETTVGGLTNDIEYTFEVRAVNEAGDGEAASTSATPHFVINESEATSVSFAEIPEGTQEWNPLVATYTTNKAEDTPVTWSLGGTDKSAFVITETDGAGTLSFSAAPDYENPTDADTDTVYAVTVRAQVRAGHPDGLDGLCRGGGESDQ